MTPPDAQRPSARPSSTSRTRRRRRGRSPRRSPRPLPDGPASPLPVGGGEPGRGREGARARQRPHGPQGLRRSVDRQTGAEDAGSPGPRPLGRRRDRRDALDGLDGVAVPKRPERSVLRCPETESNRRHGDFQSPASRCRRRGKQGCARTTARLAQRMCSARNRAPREGRARWWPRSRWVARRRGPGPGDTGLSAARTCPLLMDRLF